jgi:hypothetical protein
MCEHEYEAAFINADEDNVDEDQVACTTATIMWDHAEMEKKWLADNPTDPIVVELWNNDLGEEESDSSLPRLKYYCPKCRTTMTKYGFEQWAKHGKKIIPGFHVYHRGYHEAWDCGPLKMYDPKTDFGEPLYAHHCVYKGIPIESEEHLAEIKAKEARGEPIPGSEPADDERRYIG